jgi:hypothetical protein
MWSNDSHQVLKAVLSHSFKRITASGLEPTANGEKGSVSKLEISVEGGPNGGLTPAMNGPATADPSGVPEAAAGATANPTVPEAAAGATANPTLPETAAGATDNPKLPEAIDAGVVNGAVATSSGAGHESRTEPPAAAHADGGAVSTPAGKVTPSADQLSAVASSIHTWLSRPRVRLIVTGAMLLLIDGLFLTNSVWTLPLGIVGALMVVIGWVGGRLDGRFTVEWGETGTQLEFRARIAAPPPPRASLPPASPVSRALLDMPQPTAPDAGMIEGEAHTVEIDLAELEALIAAAETADAESPHTDASMRAVHKLQAARAGEQPSL